MTTNVREPDSNRMTENIMIYTKVVYFKHILLSHNTRQLDKTEVVNL